MRDPRQIADLIRSSPAGGDLPASVEWAVSAELEHVALMLSQIYMLSVGPVAATGLLGMAYAEIRRSAYLPNQAEREQWFPFLVLSIVAPHWLVRMACIIANESEESTKRNIEQQAQVIEHAKAYGRWGIQSVSAGFEDIPEARKEICAKYARKYRDNRGAFIRLVCNDPAIRLEVGINIGGRKVGSAVRGIKCPECGRNCMYFWIQPIRQSAVVCSDTNCGARMQLHQYPGVVPPLTGSE